MQNGKLRTAVIGAGKMGAIHAKVYDQLSQSEFVGVVDIDSERAKTLADRHKCEAFVDCADILGKVDAVTIAAPTMSHLELARTFIENGVSVMIEGCYKDFSEYFGSRTLITLIFEKMDEFFDNGVLIVTAGDENII